MFAPPLLLAALGMLLGGPTGRLVAAEADEAAQNVERAQKLADVRSEFDWSAWQSLPVLHEGRVKPIDTVARETCLIVTAGRRWTHPETKVTYQPHELLFAWMADLDHWAHQPLIRCEFRPLRELLGDEIDPRGLYVTVNDVIDWDVWKAERRFEFRSDAIRERFEKLSRAQRMQQMQGESGQLQVGDTPEERELNEKVQELILHIEAFIVSSEARNLMVVPGLDPQALTKQTNPNEKHRPWVSLGHLLDLEQWRQETQPPPTIAAILSDSPEELADALLLQGLGRLSREQGIERSYEELQSLKAQLEDEGLLPRSGAYPIEHLAQLAQAQKLKDDLSPKLNAIPSAFAEMASAYREGSRQAFDSATEVFARKVTQLAEALNDARLEMTPPEARSIDFGMFNEAVWAAYEPLELSERQMSFSAYPGPDATQIEMLYNRQKPFERAWIIFLVALFVLALSMIVKFPKAVYSVGIVLSVGAIIYSTWGFALRVMISGRAPVTDMYETVIWVAYTVAILGLIFGLLPMFGPGLSWSWRLTGLPFRKSAEGWGLELNEPQGDERLRSGARFWLPIQAVTSVLRVSLFAGVVSFMTRSNTTFQIIELVPTNDEGVPFAGVTGSEFGLWLIGIATVGVMGWYGSRAVLAALLGLVTMVTERQQLASEDVWSKLFSRRFFVMPAMAVACFGMMLAHFVGNSNPEVLDPEIGSIAAVLRNNYWLTIHVLTIVTSYGAGALAWGIGNVALAYYLFGRYETDEERLRNALEDKPPARERILERLRKAGRSLRPNAIRQTVRSGMERFGEGDAHLQSSAIRPPREVSTLATYAYRVMQVAVLLLAAGTILGGLWADKSWGRFWDWDPKEVWALISLLVYLVVLHGRFAGWIGTFGTNAWSSLCFTAIIMSWYGVNFVLPQIHGWLRGTNQPTEVGLHSYATGAGGLEYVATMVAINALFVLAAWVRYSVETVFSQPKPPSSGTAQAVPTETEPEEVAAGV